MNIHSGRPAEQERYMRPPTAYISQISITEMAILPISVSACLIVLVISLDLSQEWMLIGWTHRIFYFSLFTIILYALL